MRRILNYAKGNGFGCGCQTIELLQDACIADEEPFRAALFQKQVRSPGTGRILLPTEVYKIS